MIAIFTVLGLVLFGGGAYAIFDGWPYLVLERGFTQVIIGSIASSAGLILLSLAWILREIGALRRSLAAGVPVRAAAEEMPASTEVPRAPWEAAREERSARLSPVVPAAVGAVAGAAAASAVADALVVSSPEPESAPKPDRDLFGALVAQRLEEPQPEQDEEPKAPAQPVGEPLPDMFAEEFAEKVDEGSEAPIAVEAESHEPVEIVAAKIQPIAEDEALAHAAEPIVHPESTQAHEDRHPDEEAPSRTARNDVDFDEFSALRESLAGHLNETAPSGTRTEPSLSVEADPFAAVEAWMDKASPRREPWFESPPATEGTEAEAAPPAWPPRTEAPEFASAEPPAAKVEEESDLAAEARDDIVTEAAEETATVEEANEDATAPAPPERAASDEGVVGAYQVGDAHFTIYADGSIRARTPDGEYSFASMDELKVYLASEKNRLGM